MTDGQARVLAFPQAPEAIEMRHLRSFVAVAEELNFGRAAERLYLSQPALSRQIRTLERLVGCELLHRSTHRVELSVAGEALLERARRLLRDLDEAVTITQSVGDEIANRVAMMWRPLAQASESPNALQEMRAAYEGLHAQFVPPPEAELRPANLGGVAGLLVGAEPDRPPALLYLHGGGYMLGSALGYRPLVGALAVAAGVVALVPEFRLAPEHPYPAGLDDARRAYVWLLEQGVAPERVTVAGDSSGGGMVVSLLLRLRDEGLPLPGGALLFCPGVDLTGETLARRLESDRPEPAATIEQIRQAAQAYLAGHPIDDPLVSPLQADLTGLPPMLVQAATGDFLLEDAKALTDRARAHGVDARLELYPVTTHGFQLFWSFLPEAAAALQDAGRFVADLHGGSYRTDATTMPRR